MMKLALLTGTVLLAASGLAQAQLSVGADGLTVTSGTLFYTDGLALQPYVNLTLTSNTLQRTTTPATTANGGSSIARLYDFSAPIVFNGTATIYYNDGELNNLPENNLQIAYRNGTAWTTTTGSTVNTTGNTVSIPLNNATFNRITAASGSTPLPVDLLDFAARKTGADRQALLRWEVAAEDGLARYEIQRGADGIAFTAIGSVPATGLSAYTWTDASPAPGRNYYRLRMEDASGAERFSPVRQLSFGDVAGSAAGILILPNPTSGRITVGVDAGLTGTEAELLDATSRSLQRIAVTGTSFPVDLSGYAAGVYLLRTADGRVTRIVKN